MLSPRSYATLLVCFCMSWILRLATNPKRMMFDLLVCLFIAAVRHSMFTLDATTGWLPEGYSIASASTMASISALIIFVCLNWPTKKRRRHSINGSEPPLKPMLFPCRTTHTRLLPQVHSFSYSYLYAGVPIGWKGSAGSLLSADYPEGKTWFNVQSEDYLQRGVHPGGLAGKLKDYLRSQNVPENRYAYAYLVTAPRILGFSFNPVSFWYLYSEGKGLNAMILEVNNTFDERRMYLCERSEEKSLTSESQQHSFSFAWPKDFHVSPFNSRDGTYSVTAADPFFPKFQGSGHVDCNIVLHAEDGKPKLVARVFSTEEPPLIPQTTNRLTSLAFVLKWWWVGFMTNPRILREARKLWVKGLEVFYRPEVMLGSIGRTATVEETAIESQFARFLEAQAIESKERITYISAAGSHYGIPQQFGPSTADFKGKSSNRNDGLRIEIFTPAFYTEIVRLGSIQRAIRQSSLPITIPTARMLDISHPKLLEQTLASSQSNPIPHQRFPFKFILLSSLRSLKNSRSIHQPTDQSTPLSPSSLSDLDYFVLSQTQHMRSMSPSSSQPSSSSYVKASIRTLLRDSLAWGYDPIFKTYLFLFWIVGCVLASKIFDIFFKSGTEGFGSQGTRMSASVWIGMLGTLFLYALSFFHIDKP